MFVGHFKNTYIFISKTVCPSFKGKMCPVSEEKNPLKPGKFGELI